MIFFLYTPIIIGAIMLLFAKPVGAAFCKFGKATWRIATLGKTDMAFFYPEDKAPMIMRLVGGSFIVFGIMFLAIAGFPFKGPGQLKAMSEAKDYLNETYGSSPSSWSLSAKSESSNNTIVSVGYRFNQHSGVLHAEWIGERYRFTEKK